MVNNSLSVVLAVSSCDRNYLMRSVVNRPIWFRGRKYWFVETKIRSRYDLYCNGVLIGDLYIDKILIYDEYSHIIKSVDVLKSLIAMFNLFPA